MQSNTDSFFRANRMKRRTILVSLGIVTIYLLTRVFTVTNMPIFIDEAIYVRWAQLIVQDPSNLFLSLTDGKQPLFIWLTASAMILVDDPLLAGRIISVISGLLTVLGLFLLTRLLFRNNNAAIFSALAYVLYPMAMVYDRMALYDSLVGTLSIYSLFFLIVLIQKPKVRAVIPLGLVWGFAIINKSSGFLFMFLSVGAVLLTGGKKFFVWRSITRYVCLLLFSGIIAFGMYAVLLLSPKFYMINDKNALFIYHLAELIPYRAFDAWPGNIFLMGKWVVMYLTLSFIFPLCYTLFYKRDHGKQKALLVLQFLTPLILLGLFGRVIYPRFIFFMTLSLLPLVGLGIHQLFDDIRIRRELKTAFFVVLLSPVLFSMFMLVRDFSRSPIPSEDLVQYSNDWPSGGGMKEIISILEKKQFDKGDIAVYTEGQYGGLPTTVSQIYLGSNQHVALFAFDTFDKELKQSLVLTAYDKPTFVIFNQLQRIPRLFPLRLIGQYRKGSGNSYSRLYEVVPQ